MFFRPFSLVSFTELCSGMVWKFSSPCTRSIISALSLVIITHDVTSERTWIRKAILGGSGANGLNVLWEFRKQMKNCAFFLFWQSDSSTNKTPRSSSKTFRCASYFQLYLVIKHFVSCLIYYVLGADHLTLEGVGVISGHQELFSSNLVSRIFFPFFPLKLCITFVLHAIFFFRQALAGNFFSKLPTPAPARVKWSAPQ